LYGHTLRLNKKGNAMRVLVTRPGKDGQDLVKILGDLGIDSMLEPLLTVRNLNTNSLNTEGVQAYLLTSANGINALINANPDYSIPLFAVGDATAVTARLGGFKTVHSASGDVSALANLVADILEPSGGSLIHATSSSNTGDLKKKLEKNGFKYRKEIVYETEAAKSLSPEVVATLKAGSIDAILLYSPQTAEILIQLLRKFRLVRSCKNTLAVCLSQAIAAKVEAISWEEIRVAKLPTQDDLLSCLKSYFDIKNTTKDKNEGSLNNSEMIDDTPRDTVTKPIQGRGGGTFRTVCYTLLVVAILIGGGSASTNIWLPKAKELLSFLGLEDGNKIKHGFLAERLKKLETESVINIPRMEELEAERQRLQTKLDTTLARVDALEKSINVTKKMISAVNPGTGPSAAKATLKNLVERLNRLESDRSSEVSKNEQQIDQLAIQLDKLKKNGPYLGNRDLNDQAGSFLIAIGQLRSAIRSGSSFSSEISSLNAFGSNAKDILDAHLDLKNYADLGISNPIQLQEAFSGIAGKIVQSDRLPERNNLIDRTIVRLSKSLKWRRTDMFEGNSVEAIVARTERALKNNNIEKAARELEVLPNNLSPLAQPWLRKARANVAANKMLADLQAKAISMLIAKE